MVHVQLLLVLLLAGCSCFVDSTGAGSSSDPEGGSTSAIQSTTAGDDVGEEIGGVPPARTAGSTTEDGGPADGDTSGLTIESSSASSGDDSGSSSTGSEGRLVDVLLLDDGSAHIPTIETALTAAGHRFENVGAHSTWEGEGIDDETDVVLSIEGSTYGTGLTTEGSVALTGFLLGGGMVIRTEWSLYSAAQGLSDSDFDQYLPAVSPNAAFDYGTTWYLVGAEHPIAAGLPQSWVNVGSGCTVAIPNPGAEVIMGSSLCGAAVIIERHGSGLLVHINDDFGAEAVMVDSNSLAVLVNTVGFAAL